VQSASCHFDGNPNESSLQKHPFFMVQPKVLLKMRLCEKHENNMEPAIVRNLAWLLALSFPNTKTEGNHRRSMLHKT